MDAGRRSFAHGVDFNLVGGGRSVVHPAVLGPEFGDDALGQRDGRTAGRILLLRVVPLLDGDLVAAHAVDQRGELAVEPEHQIDPQAVVRGVEKGAATLAAECLKLLQAGGPARRAAHHRNAACDAGADVVAGRSRRGELQRHVDPRQVGRVELRGILRIDDECDLVAALQKYLFNFTAHLAVTDDCCLHLFRVYNICAQR